LKPENILLTFDHNTEKCVDLKLCDFGLSTKFKQKVHLNDFCGSPGLSLFPQLSLFIVNFVSFRFSGFFAPEMISQGSYFGDKVDVWSVGCILLELVLGHERFCDIWMVAYDYDILQNKELFTSTITETVDQLPDLLNFSPDLNDFILRFLEMKPLKRPIIRSLAVHPWLNGELDEAIAAGALIARLHSNGGEGGRFSPPCISPSVSFSMDAMDLNNTDTAASQEAIKQAFNNLSDRERRQMEEYILQRKDGENLMKLPPIMPETPNIGGAKKILRKGNELASRSYGPSSNSPQFFVQEITTPITPVHYGFNSPGNNSPHGGRSPLPSLLEDDGKNSTLNSTFSPRKLEPSPRKPDLNQTPTKPNLFPSRSENNESFRLKQESLFK
jgi:serine/threonine protein kinase